MSEESATLRRAIEFLIDVNSLADVPREGYVMNGVERPECVAAHSAGVAATALMIADRTSGPVDREKILTMAILHDLGEARVGDVPLVRKTKEDDRQEEEAANAMVADLPERYRAVLDEYRERRSLESRIVKAADKLQLMVKVLAYERAGRGDLSGFWENPKNFVDCDLEAARALYEELLSMKNDMRVDPS